MRKSSSLRFSALLGSALLISVLSARAQVVVTPTESLLTDWTTNSIIQQIGIGASTSLLEAGSPTFSSLTANNPANTSLSGIGISTYNSGLNDGLDIGSNGGGDYGASAYYGYNSSSNGGAAKANLIVGNELGNGGEVVTFNLNTGNSAAGYDINSVDTIAGWTDHASVSNQNYTLAYSLVGSPTSFTTLTSVAYNPNNPVSDSESSGGYASEVSLTDLDLTGVAALQFTFTPDPTSVGYGPSGTGLWMQEVQAFGAATAVPEPSTWAMMVVGAAGVVVLSLRRKLRA